MVLPEVHGPISESPNADYNNPQGPMPEKVDHSIFKNELPNSEFGGGVCELYKQTPSNSRAIIFLHKIYEILKKDYK